MTRLLHLLGLAALATADTKFVQGDPARFTYTNMQTPLSGPCDVSEGTDGLIYIQQVLANKIARYNQNTGELKEFDIPFSTRLLPNETFQIPSLSRTTFLTCSIRNGFDGKMYFSNGNRNQLVQFDAATEQIKLFTVPGKHGSLVYSRQQWLMYAARSSWRHWQSSTIE